MKVLLTSIIMVIGLVFAMPSMANDKSKIKCPCGCNQLAVVCGCPVAKDALKKIGV